MTRSIELSRDDAELLVDLLMASDHWLADDLERLLRQKWGMASQEQQLAAHGLTLEQWRAAKEST